MKWLKVISIAMFAAGVYVGCSEVEFKARKGERCKEFPGECVLTPDGYYQLTGSTKAGRVDILVVDDNSGSMYTEQSQMAFRFPNFLSGVGNLDYQIAIITTDVSASPGNNVPREANGFGAFQDGKFLKFPNDQTILKASTPNVVDLFRETVKRPETLVCDTSGYTNCPSGDERGIYALNLAFDRADRNFFREGAHLAVVVLSDENGRSNGGQIQGYPLETYDLPETLVSKLGEVFGPSKVMSVHSVIIQPGDTACLAAQNNQGAGIRGYEGTHFAQLSQPSADLKARGNIVNGSMGSICASDYGAQLGDIGSVINQNVNMIQLACDPVQNQDGSSSLAVTFAPTPAQPIAFSVDDQNRLILTPPAPAGTSVNYTYKCPRTI